MVQLAGFQIGGISDSWAFGLTAGFLTSWAGIQSEHWHSDYCRWAFGLAGLQTSRDYTNYHVYIKLVNFRIKGISRGHVGRSDKLVVASNTSVLCEEGGAHMCACLGVVCVQYISGRKNVSNECRAINQQL